MIVLNIKKSNEIFYKIENCTYEYLIFDNNYVYEIKNVSNFFAKQKNKDSIIHSFKEYALPNSHGKKINKIAISQLQYETNFLGYKKYEYDIEFSNRNVSLNVQYPEEQKGNYKFTISKDELTALESIAQKIIHAEGIIEGFSNEHTKRPEAIVLDHQVINNYSYIKNNLDCSTIIAFANYIILKNLNVDKKNRTSTIKDDIVSSKYVRRFDIDIPHP